MKILIADEHDITILGLKTCLKERFHFVSFTEAKTCEQTWQSLSEECPDLLILDIAMNGARNIEFMHQIRAAYPRLGIIVYTMLEERYGTYVLASGADAFVLKRHNFETLFYNIENIWIKRKRNNCKERLIPRFPLRSKKNAFEKLSRREMEVMLLLFEGRRNKEISMITGLAPTSVTTYKNRFLEKLGSDNLMELRDLYWFYARASA